MRPYYNYISLPFSALYLKARALKRCLTTILIWLFIIPTISIAQAPVADFTADKTSGCAPLTVKFTDLSTNTPTAWIWDFGFTLSTQQNPIINFSAPGTYTVKLIARNNSGIDEEEKINYITVYESPSANFTANITTACVPATIQFTDQTTVPPGGGTIVSYSWNFGVDGTSVSNLQNPSYTYTSPGFYTVTL